MLINFQLTSTLLLTVGGAIQTLYNDFNHFLDDNFLSVPALMVAIGIMMLIVAAFGVIGALKESTMLTNIVNIFVGFFRIGFLTHFLVYINTKVWRFLDNYFYNGSICRFGSIFIAWPSRKYANTNNDQCYSKLQ